MASSSTAAPHGPVVPLTTKRHRIVITASLVPGRAELLSALEAAAWANARWFVAMREAGREPPCCIGCSGLRYDPDRPAVDVSFATGDELLVRGHGSCGELVAFDVGRLRADVLKTGGDPAQAARTAWPDLQPEPAKPGTEKWHALERVGSTIVDVTTKIPRRSGARPSAAAVCGCGGNHG